MREQKRTGSISWREQVGPLVRAPLNVRCGVRLQVSQNLRPATSGTRANVTVRRGCPTMLSSSLVGLPTRLANGVACSKPALHYLPRRYGCLLRVGGGAVRSGAEGKTRGGGRTAERARSGGGGVLCGAQVRGAFGDAAPDGLPALPAGDLRGGPSGALPRILRARL